MIYRKLGFLTLLLLIGGMTYWLRTWKDEEPLIRDEVDHGPHLQAPPHATLTEPVTHLNFPNEDIIAARQIQAAFATGDYGRCLKLADLYLSQKNRSPIFLAWLKKQLDPVLTALGWLKLKTGRCDQAIEYFVRAEKIQLSLDNAKGLTYCYNMIHSLDLAEEKALWFISKSPKKDSDVMLIYSEVLESKGRFAEATNILEALAENDKSTKLKQKISSMREKAKRANLLQTINTKFFSITFEEQAHREVAEKTLDYLKESLDELVVTYHFREPTKPIEVVLYPVADFLSINPLSPQWAEALFDGRLRVPIQQPYNLNHLKTVLRHELVHALFSQMTGSRPLPAWFDEGVAQVASNCERGCVPFAFELNPGSFLTEKVLNKPFTAISGEVLARKAYKQSIYLVLTLEAFKGREGIQSMIENIQIDSPLDSDSLLQHFSAGFSFSELLKRASAHWEKRDSFR